jgi:hypothetical protein
LDRSGPYLPAWLILPHSPPIWSRPGYGWCRSARPMGNGPPLPWRLPGSPIDIDAQPGSAGARFGPRSVLRSPFIYRMMRSSARRSA